MQIAVATTLGQGAVFAPTKIGSCTAQMEKLRSEMIGGTALKSL
jgi:hypothetical protein